LYPALIADCAAYDEYKNHTSVPFTIGIIAIAPKIASLVRSWIIPAVLAIVGFSSKIDPETASREVKIGVLNMFMLIPGCITISAGLILFLFYDLTKARLEEMNKGKGVV
jgi:Na+/melibiose symporter-like transporter